MEALPIGDWRRLSREDEYHLGTWIGDQVLAIASGSWYPAKGAAGLVDIGYGLLDKDSPEWTARLYRFSNERQALMHEAMSNELKREEVTVSGAEGFLETLQLLEGNFRAAIRRVGESLPSLALFITLARTCRRMMRRRSEMSL